MHQTNGYCTISKSVKGASQNICQGKRYGLLEGGYNHQALFWQWRFPAAQP
ncbi:MAG: hypothetical protein JW732_08020 [Dehalococcoidia bacterium]|nr:hypothetical protein [Dehalococcoidia bacterium]